MPEVISIANGNFNSSSTWRVSCGGTNATQESNATLSSATASYVYCPPFTCNTGDSIIGVLLKCRRQSGDASNTFTVALSDDNGVTATREIAIGVSDIPLSFEQWIFFKFGTPLTADGGSDYRIGVKSSTTTTVSVGRDATAANWTRVVVTDTAATPAAGDRIFVGSGKTGNTTDMGQIVVTMNETAVTNYANLAVMSGGRLQYGTSASTNYVLQINGLIEVQTNGAIWIGNSSDPIPSSSTANLQINVDNSTGGLFGINVFTNGVFHVFGSPRTAGKEVSQTKLSTNVSASANIFPVDHDTGWLSGDIIWIGSGSNSATEAEIFTVSTSNSTAITTNETSSFLKRSDSVHKCPIINISRNVVFKSVGVSLATPGYLKFQGNCYADVRWSRFADWGQGTSAEKAGVTFYRSNTSYYYRMSHCSFSDKVGYSIAFNSSQAQIANVYLDNIVFANTSQTQTLPSIITNSITPFVNAIFDDITYISKTSTSGYIFFFSGSNISCNNITLSGGTNGLYFSPLLVTHGPEFSIVANNLFFNSLGGSAVVMDNNSGNVKGKLSINNMKFNSSPASYGLNMQYGKAVVSNYSSSNSYYALYCGYHADLTLYNANISVSLAPILMYAGNLSIYDSSITATGATAAVVHANPLAAYQNEILFSNVLITATTEFSGNLHLWSEAAKVTLEHHDQTLGNHKIYKPFGRIEIDTTIYNTSSPSERLTPNTASGKLESTPRIAPVSSGSGATISVKVRKSQAGDGAAYNGTEPRLIVLAAPALGIATNTVLDTMTYSNSSWETLTGTTGSVSETASLRFVVDCDGTAGWINLDEWEVS